MRVKTNIGMSLDGFIASAEGLPAWDFAPNFWGSNYGHAETIADCRAVIVGRTCFDQGLPHWTPDWPYGDRDIHVLTTRPLSAEIPAGQLSTAAGVSAWREATRDIEGEAFLLGGAGVFRAFLEAGAIDEIGIVVLPVLLGSGIPLFDAQAVSFSPERWAAFMEAQTPPAATVLESSGYQAGPEGAVKLIYKSPQAQE